MAEVPTQSPAELVESLRQRCHSLVAEVERLRHRRRAVEKYYSVAEVALLLSFSERWVRNQVKSGAINGVIQIGRDLRIPASSINSLCDRCAWNEMGIPARTVGELRRRLIIV